MTKYMLIAIGMFALPSVKAQSISQALLDVNNVSAIVNDGGTFFTDYANQSHGYEVPKGYFANAIYAMSFWYGGQDVNGQLKISIQQYENLADQFKGPLSIDGTATAPPAGTWLNALFPVLKSEIDNHIANYASPGYTIPSSIANWSAHGDVSLNQDFYLAPFVDVDGNGIYDPSAGDYPCIRGDKAIYVIMNDKGAVHASGGDPIGIEMHYMFYQYELEPGLENTTFVHLELINRGAQTLYDFKVSTFIDGDVGYFGDDYFGSDSTRNMMYFYNADNLDEGQSTVIGYGMAPPAIGLVSLNQDFESIGIMGATSGIAAECWNNMNGLDPFGASWIDPITSDPISYMYPSDPANPLETRSEVSLGNIPGDRRGIANINIGTLVPFSEHSFDYAIVYNRDLSTDNLVNASGLKNVADFVQDYFDNSITNDCVENNTASLQEESKEIRFSIHPNPSNGQFSLVIGEDFANATVEISDLYGRVVLEASDLASKESIITLTQPSGIYFVHLNVDGNTTVKRIIVE